jgi:hypothetical protein
MNIHQFENAKVVDIICFAKAVKNQCIQFTPVFAMRLAIPGIYKLLAPQGILSATAQKKSKNSVIPELADGRKPLSGICCPLALRRTLSATTPTKSVKSRHSSIG